MEIVGRKRLEKFKRKNRGNTLLCKAIDKLLKQLETKDWNNPTELVKDRPDADKVHKEGFYFFNIHIHRIMILIEFEEGQATIVWCGTHDDYDLTFKNNKNTIEKWLKENGLIN
jgi:mRNA interferase HigB